MQHLLRGGGGLDVLQSAGDTVIDQNRQQDVAGKLLQAAEMLEHREKRVSAAEVFKKFDSDGSGELERREVRLALKDMGIDPNSKLVQRQIKRYDADGSGSLDIDEFEAFVNSVLAAEADEAESASILNAFDNLPYMTAVPHGDRMALVRSAELHHFGPSSLVLAYPPDPLLGHLSFSNDHVALIVSGAASLLLAGGRQPTSPHARPRRRLVCAVPGERAVRAALGGPLMPVATLAPLTCIMDNLLPGLESDAAAAGGEGAGEEARWCLQPLHGHLECAFFPKREWEAALGSKAIVGLREEAALHAGFFTRCAERTRAPLRPHCSAPPVTERAPRVRHGRCARPACARRVPSDRLRVWQGESPRRLSRGRRTRSD